MDIKLKRDKLVSNSELIEQIFNRINSAIFLIDESRDVLEYNKAFEDMFNINYTFNEIKCFKAINIGSKKSGIEYFKLRFKEEDQNKESRRCVLNRAVNRAIKDNLETKNQVVGDEYLVDGEVKHLYLKFSVIPINADNNRFILVTIDDISEFEKVKFNLLKNNMKIKRYNNMYKDELIMARKVQSGILPKKTFKSSGISIDFRYFPLREIGGDFFDFFRIDETHIAVLLCDVAGHGVASALVTTVIKTIIESSKHLYLHPKNLVKYINNQIIKIFDDCFLSMIYGVIDTSNGNFTYVRAGHPKPWLIEKTSISTMGLKTNIILGVDPKAKFEEDSLQLNFGAKLMLFTDGLIDIGRKNSGYEKEIMKLVKEVNTDNPRNTLNKIEKNIKERLKDEKHQDDICVLMIERLSE